MPDLLRGGKGRPLHPMLVHFPLALYPTSLLFDVLSYLADDGTVFVQGAFSLIVAALVVSVPVVATGFADFLRIENGSRTWRLAASHMTVMLVTAGLFLADAMLRSRDLEVTQAPVGPLILSLFGVGMLTLGGLLGGDLVYRHGMRVEAGPIVVDDQPEVTPPVVPGRRAHRSGGLRRWRR